MTYLQTASDQRLQILANITSPLHLFDVENIGIVWANDSALAHWCADSLAELHGRNFGKDITHTVKLKLRQMQHDCHIRGKVITEYWTVYPKQIPKSNTYFISAFVTTDGRQMLLMEIQQEESKDSETCYRTSALMHTATMISAYDECYKLVYCNPAARLSIKENCDTLQQRLLNSSDMFQLETALSDNQICDVELEVRTTSGDQWHTMQLQRCTNPSDGKPMLLISATDATERRKAQQEAYRLAYTDSLTNLPNRAALISYLNELILNAQTSTDDYGFALFFLDLDRFKVINDSLGHAAGDQLLIDVAQRLKQSVDKSGQVYRLGGDEFVMITPGKNKKQSLKKTAENVMFAMAEPLKVSDHNLRILPSIGIVSFPDDGTSISELLENADTAMYIAKAQQSGYCFYDLKMSSTLSASVKDRMGLENDLIAAIDNDEFELFFQPKISCDTMSVSGVEALIRWHHPTRGIVPPDKFIGIAEETGQIIDLGNWVLRAAMQQQKRWHDQGYLIPVSVNISARQFSANDLLANVSDNLKATGCEPDMIELEITESMLIGEPDVVHDTLQQLSAMGIRLALDDFGTGYSNLAYLQKYPLDSLKIDKVFLADRRRSMLMGTILNMGKVLGLSVVAEGVETHSQAEWLIANGCDVLQGFYFSKPLPVGAATSFLKENGAPTHKTLGRVA